MKNLLLAVVLLLTWASYSQTERPYYTSSELYVIDEHTGSYEFDALEFDIGAVKFLITDSTVVKGVSNITGTELVQSTVYTIDNRALTEVDIKGNTYKQHSYELSIGGKLYILEYYDDDYNEIMWLEPSGIMRITQGDIQIKED